MSAIFGTTGDDTLTGTAGDDSIAGLQGDDVIDAGAGNDIITDGGFSNTIAGGDGNDRITLIDPFPGSIFTGIPTTNVINAGDGNDVVRVEPTRQGSLTVDLGTGNDHLFLGVEAAFRPHDTHITLGAGQDQVTLGFGFGDGLRMDPEFQPVVINDFTAGAGGDVLDLADLVRGWWFNPSLGSPAANPFQSGHLRLVQDGADVIVRLDYDGNGPFSEPAYLRDVVRLVGVSAGDLVAANFGGFSPDGAAPAAATVTGTSGDDLLQAGVYGGQTNGLAGNDELIGSPQADTIDGGDGNDTIEGGAGNDSLLGGAGDDVLDDSLGNDTIEGGAGNDVIAISRSNAGYSSNHLNETISIFGGDGNDRVSFEIVRQPFTTVLDRTAQVSVDLGAGNDAFFVANTISSISLMLGEGQDRVEFSSAYFYTYNPNATPVVVSDFAAGDAGDVLELNVMVGTGWNLAGNPFATGHLVLLQDGADVVVSVDYDGLGGSSSLDQILRLENVSVGDLTAFNFAGFDPGGSANAGLVLNGTAADETIFGAAGNDSIAGDDGTDELHGGFGNDTIDGGGGNDFIEGGYGNDQLAGGGGNDTVQDLGWGSDTLAGGDGDDRIVVDHPYNGFITDHVSVDAGVGADVVEFQMATAGTLTADLGDGDDRIMLKSFAQGGATLTLGTGSDVVALDPMLASQVWGPIVITDFQAGDGGDRIDWLLYAQLKTNISGADFNPFGAGVAVLEQSGADTRLRLTGPGAPADPIIVFLNTNKNDFTNYNLGTDISATPPVSETDTYTGTEANDTYPGTDVRDVMSGLGGNDSLSGAGGNDLLKGGAGDDTLSGGDGNDALLGGDGLDYVDGGPGNDVITDSDGLDVILGGIGDDTISVLAQVNAPLGSTDAGDGNDNLTIDLETGRPYSASLGVGDDHVLVRAISWNLTLSLGSGSDTVVLSDNFLASNGGVLIFADFQTGTGGDSLQVDGLLERGLFGAFQEWSAGENPFGQGYLDLRQVGPDVELWLNTDGLSDFFSSFRQAVFVGTTVDQFTAANFAGYDPQVVPNNAHLIRDGEVVGPGQTEASLNTTPVGDKRPHYVFAAGDDLFVNHGTITTVATVAGAFLTGMMVSPYSSTGADALFLNAADGSFVVDDQWVDVSGIYVLHKVYGVYDGSSAGMGFQNDGHFEVNAVGGTVTGVLTGFWSPVENPNGHPLSNNGTFVVTSDAGDAWGMELGANGSFVNNGEMSIHGGEFAVGIYSGQYHAQPIVNNGTITVTVDPDSDLPSVGIWLPEIEAPFLGHYDHWNNGTINADIALAVEEINTHLPHDYIDVLHNSGAINGAVLLGAGNDQILNTGSMSGGSFLEDGDDLYDGTAGLHSGWVDGGAGNDTLRGGAGDDDFVGGDGNDSLVGGGGSNTLEGGAGDDTYVVTSIGDRIYDSGGNDTLYVSVDNFKVPVGIENVIRLNGAKPLPYFLDAVVSGERWDHFGSGNIVLTYGFLTEATDGAGAGGTGFYAFTPEQEDMARTALGRWGEVSGIAFAETSDLATADLKFGSNDQDDFGSLGYAFYPPTAEIFIDHDEGFLLGVLVHEVGHALGLKHPFEEPGVLPVPEDNDANTVMSYTSASAGEIASVPGPFDLASIHYLYGVDASARSGNDSYGFGQPYVWDGAGNDTISAAAETLSAHIDLNPGSWNWIGAQTASVLDAGQSFLGFGTSIENAVGGNGNDTLIGNALGNRLEGGVGADTMSGGAGNDTLQGGAGADRLVGGVGDDAYVVDATDQIVELANEGVDTIWAAATFSIAALPQIENVLLLSGGALDATGNGAANVLTGNGSRNVLSGGGGNDTLEGNGGRDTLVGGAGNDQLDGGAAGGSFFSRAGNNLSGGTGDDLYIVNSGADQVWEAPGEGNDTVQSAQSYRLGANVENLVLTGTAWTSGTGNELANRISGNAGANSLNGGLGADTLTGGAGADRFVFDSSLASSDADVITDFDRFDRICLDEDVYTAFGQTDATRALATASFWTGPAAHDADDRIIYNVADGSLRYDADGSGAGASVLIATLGTSFHPQLTFAEFQIIG